MDITKNLTVNDILLEGLTASLHSLVQGNLPSIKLISGNIDACVKV